MNRFTRPKMGDREKSIDLGIKHLARFFEVVHEVLAHSRAPDTRRLVGNCLRWAPERIALLGQPRVADNQVGRQSAHLLDHIRPRCPQVSHVGDISLARKRLDTLSTEFVDQIKPIGVRTVEMHAHTCCSVESGSQRKRLPDAPVLSGPGDEYPFAFHARSERFETELVCCSGERHGLLSSQFETSPADGPKLIVAARPVAIGSSSDASKDSIRTRSLLHACEKSHKSFGAQSSSPSPRGSITLSFRFSEKGRDTAGERHRVLNNPQREQRRFVSRYRSRRCERHRYLRTARIRSALLLPVLSGCIHDCRGFTPRRRT